MMIPNRLDFLNKGEIDASNKIISDGKPITFMPNDVIQIDDQNEVKFYIFGVLGDGRNATVVLRNVPSFVEVFDVKLHQLEAVLDGIEVINYEEIEKYKLHGFSINPTKGFRVYFTNLKQRTNALYRLTNHLVGSAEPASSYNKHSTSYYNKIASEFKFNTADWNTISKYKVLKSNLFTTDLVFECDIDNFDAITFDELKQHHQLFGNKDKLVCCSWDIETYSYVNTGEMPDITAPNTWDIFNICLVFGYYHTDETICKVSIVNADILPHDNIDVNLECKDERELLVTFLKVISAMAPNYMSAFNGYGFDWKYTHKKLEEYKLLRAMLNSISLFKDPTVRDDYITKNYFTKDYEVKIMAQNYHMCELIPQFPGVIETDARLVFRKLYPTANAMSKSSLNLYLEKNDLESKIDMPYLFMFKIYEWSQIIRTPQNKKFAKTLDKNEMFKILSKYKESIPFYDVSTFKESSDDDVKWLVKRLMTEVCNYCVVDSYRIQQLYNKQSVISTHKDLANMSCVAITDAYWRANSNKVINFTSKYCSDMNIIFNGVFKRKTPEEKVNIPGGKVFNPIRGLNKECPLTALDFSSLYPSIMMACNLSPEMIITDEEYAEKLRKLGYVVLELPLIVYKMHEKRCLCHPDKIKIRAWTVYHGLVVDDEECIVDSFSKEISFNDGDEKVSFVVELKEGLKYGPNHMDSPIHSARVNPKEIDDWLTTHPNASRSVKYMKNYGRKKLKNERMGVLPKIMKDLINERGKYKKILKYYEPIIEEMRKDNLNEHHIKLGDLDKVMSLTDILFEHAVAKSRSSAVKVLMNSFYGVSAMDGSPLQSPIVSAGITLTGQEDITLVHSFVTLMNCLAMYGDTDSVYFSIDKNKLSKYDFDSSNMTEDEFLKARLRSWEGKVTETFTETKILQEEINDCLISKHNNQFLNVAYEEVGFPSFLCGKKKYFMYEHKKSINFYPKPDDVFVRGIDSIKQGKSKFTKILAKKFMLEILSPNTDISPIKMVQDIMDEYFITDWEVDDFVKTDKYKPNVQNTKVLNFVDRMREKHRQLTDEYIAGGAQGENLADLYYPPEAGEQFEYVYAEIPRTYDNRGCFVKTGKTDMMVFKGVFNHFKGTDDEYTIDKFDYADELISVLARFICYEDRFQPEKSVEEYVDYSKFDKQCIEAAKKFIENYAKQYKLNEFTDVEGKKKQTKLFKEIAKQQDEVWYYKHDSHKFVTKILNGKTFVNAIEKTTNMEKLSHVLSEEVIKLIKISQTDVDNLTLYIDNLKECELTMKEEKVSCEEFTTYMNKNIIVAMPIIIKRYELLQSALNGEIAQLSEEDGKLLHYCSECIYDAFCEIKEIKTNIMALSAVYKKLKREEIFDKQYINEPNKNSLLKEMAAKNKSAARYYVNMK